MDRAQANLNELGNVIHLLRREKGLKQYELATKLGIDKSYLSQVEQGHKVFSLQMVAKFSEVIEVPMSKIFFLVEARQELSNLLKITWDKKPLDL